MTRANRIVTIAACKMLAMVFFLDRGIATILLVNLAGRIMLSFHFQTQ